MLHSEPVNADAGAVEIQPPALAGVARVQGAFTLRLPGQSCVVPRCVGPYRVGEVHPVDCIAGMQQLPENSVDVAIADPPYNLSKGGTWKWDQSVHLPGFGGNWSKTMSSWDNLPLSEHFEFTMSWLTELKRVVKPTGSMWIHGTYHNIGVVNLALQLAGAEIINEVVWFKRNSFPNLSGRRLTASHETILWAHTGSANNREYYFAYDKSKSMACPEDRFKSNGKQMRTVWDIPNNKRSDELKFGKHPTQKPVRLLTRMLQISARARDILLVPFAGSGSDCVAAKALDVDFLGFETNPEYLRLCQRRLNS